MKTNVTLWPQVLCLTLLSSLSLQCNNEEATPTLVPNCDADGDGHAAESCGGDDCNDTEASAHPRSLELCDDLDNDCDGRIDDVPDGDADGFITCSDDPSEIDCDDTDPNVYPGAVESTDASNGKLTDRNCDGVVSSEVDVVEGLDTTVFEVPSVGKISLTIPPNSLQADPEACSEVDENNQCIQVTISISATVPFDSTTVRSAESEDFVLLSPPFHISPALSFVTDPARLRIEIASATGAKSTADDNPCEGVGVVTVDTSAGSNEPVEPFIPATDCDTEDGTVEVEVDTLEDSDYAAATDTRASANAFELEPVPSTAVAAAAGQPFSLEWSLKKGKSPFELEDIAPFPLQAIIPSTDQTFETSTHFEYDDYTALYELSNVVMTTESTIVVSREVMVWYNETSLDNQAFSATHCSQAIKEQVIKSGLASLITCPSGSKESMCLDFVNDDKPHIYLYDCATVTLTPTHLYYQDVDGDGFGTGEGKSLVGPEGDFRATQSGDCNDNNAAVNPSVIEECNGTDDNCDDQIDEGVLTTFYADNDADSHGNASVNTDACAAPTGYVTASDDCNDGDNIIYSGAVELCDQKDNDCDDKVDEDVTYSDFYADQDGDGYGNGSDTQNACVPPEGYVLEGTDCNDTAFTINPGVIEQCNGIDDNCNSQLDEGLAVLWYRDSDADGFGNPAVTSSNCAQITGFVSNSGDCDDTNAAIKPGSSELAGDSVDQNCDGVETCFKDADNDGFRPDSTSTVPSTDADCADVNEAVSTDPTTDCNDTSAAINPITTELCNGIDDNCNASTDEGVTSTWYQDADADTYGNASVTKGACSQPSGYVSNSADCNDTNASIKPGATELAGDSVDQDCNGAETCFKDSDNDGFRPDTTSTVVSTDTDCLDANEAVNTDPTTDCNDANVDIKPGATEVCNSVDDNCNGTIDDGAVPATWYRDVDGDTYGTSATTTTSCTQPTGYVQNSLDCNDANAAIKPGATELPGDSVDQNCDGVETCFKDTDNDGYRPDATSTVASTDADCLDANEAVSTDPTTDCNDAVATVKPGGVETCNSIDDDCDGLVDDGVATSTWYQDADLDTYGNASVTKSACSQPTGYVSSSSDCNDTNAAIKPGATEIAGDSVDQNCDGAETCYKDSDNDGYRPDATSTVASTDTDCTDSNEAVSTDPITDCNDANAAIKPGAVELCNTLDDDCDSIIDEGVTYSTWYKDTDGDGYGTSSTTTPACTQPTGFVSNSSDCNDGNAAIKPGATELAGDSVDQNCDGAETCFKDADNDGYRPNSTSTVASTDTDCSDSNEALSSDPTTDCDDSNAAIKPGATETCNLVDDDCDSVIDDGVKSTYYADADGDGYGVSTSTTSACIKPTGYSTVAGDCNDINPAIKPGATEIAGDSVDQNCDGAETCFKDVDNDGYRPDATSTVASTDADCNDANEAVSSDPTTDCNDNNAAIKPGVAETCNGVDDNCNGSTDEGVGSTWYRDADGDGYGTSATTVTACTKPSGYVSNSTDCNDTSAAANPGATEICDSDNVDENCNGVSDDADTTVDPGTMEMWYKTKFSHCGELMCGEGNMQCDSGNTYTKSQEFCDSLNQVTNCTPFPY